MAIAKFLVTVKVAPCLGGFAGENKGIKVSVREESVATLTKANAILAAADYLQRTNIDRWTLVSIEQEKAS